MGIYYVAESNPQSHTNLTPVMLKHLDEILDGAAGLGHRRHDVIIQVYNGGFGTSHNYTTCQVQRRDTKNETMPIICKQAFKGHDKEAEVLASMAEIMKKGWFKEIRARNGGLEKSWVNLVNGKRVICEEFEEFNEKEHNSFNVARVSGISWKA
ncbi:hypothetical protein EJ08DRAFT_377352 [Tothia fuscella]|uniref:Uncharacterized protein n=1 Tax=Tothia fuscella TaxID=1048955 RepID=A0A9P4NKV7_9PEZI|nr:hypothetical protein EJ08DRAFT_377352 [Tothia fuscella]